MTLGWEKNKRENEYQHIYPSDEEIFKYGKPVTWHEVMHETGLNSLKDLAIALKTSIGALRKQYARKDLAEKLYSNYKNDFYNPDEDYTSVFLIPSLLKIFVLKVPKV